VVVELIAPRTVVVGLRDRVDLRRSADGGRSWQQLAGAGLPASPQLLKYVDASTGWAVATTGRCVQKQNCITIGGLHSTHDGGSTWKRLQL
jgi:photosystem II stability/assembly factor-like uncharacterized protein